MNKHGKHSISAQAGSLPSVPLSQWKRQHGARPRARALGPGRPEFEFCLCHIQGSAALGSSGLLPKRERFVRMDSQCS